MLDQNNYISKVEFKLSRELKFQDVREDAYADTIVLIAPAIEHEDTIDQINNLVIKSMLGMSKLVGGETSVNQRKEENDVQAPSFSYKQVLLSLTASNELKLVKNLFKKLLISGCGKVGDKIVLTDHLVSQISNVPPCNDFLRMMGIYFKNFMLPSWMELLDMTDDT